MKYTPYVLAFLWVALAAAHEPVAPCDSDLISTGGPAGYTHRGTDLCEGLYVSRVGAPAMEIVSLTRGNPLQGRAPDHLDLSVVAALGKLQPVRLRAIGIPFGFYYRLDAIVVPGHVIDWSAGDVLNKLNVTLDKIGIFAFASDNTGTTLYIPVNIGTNQPISFRTPTVVVLRAAGIPEDVKWRFIPADSTEVVQPAWQETRITHGRITIAVTPVVGSLQIRWSDSETGQTRQASFRIVTAAA